MSECVDLPYAEDVNYWRTGKSSPDVWIGRASKVIQDLGGIVEAEAFGSQPVTGRSAFMLEFSIDGERFKMIWPVLPTRKGDERAARVQAATLLYHDAKARAISARVLGMRAAFFTYLLLADGRTAGQLAAPELIEALPESFRPRLQHSPAQA